MMTLIIESIDMDDSIKAKVELMNSLTSTTMDEILEREMEAVVNELLSELPEQIQIILRLRFFSNMTLEAIGNRIKISREVVRQKEAKGLRKLRHPNRINKLTEWMEYCNERNLNS